MAFLFQVFPPFPFLFPRPVIGPHRGRKDCFFLFMLVLSTALFLTNAAPGDPLLLVIRRDNSFFSWSQIEAYHAEDPSVLIGANVDILLGSCNVIRDTFARFDFDMSTPRLGTVRILSRKDPSGFHCPFLVVVRSNVTLLAELLQLEGTDESTVTSFAMLLLDGESSRVVVTQLQVKVNGVLMGGGTLSTDQPLFELHSHVAPGLSLAPFCVSCHGNWTAYSNRPNVYGSLRIESSVLVPFNGRIWIK